jgi:hypothetical protein
LFDPATLILAAPLGTDSRGNAWLQLPIPANATLRGIAFATQSLWAENGSCQIPAPGIASSNGVRLQLL